MNKFRLAFTCGLAAGAACLAMATPASAQMRMGTLTCNISGGVGIVVGSSRDVSCLYRPMHGRQQAYGGTVDNVGLDVGASMPGQIHFGVMGAAPMTNLGGNYSGPGLGVTLGGTVGGNVLSNPNGVMLQPLDNMRNGIGVSAGIGSINLQPIQTIYQSGRRR
jgi:hypothetical protein